MQGLLELFELTRAFQQITLLSFARGFGAFSLLAIFTTQLPMHIRLAPAIAALPAIVWGHRSVGLAPDGMWTLFGWAMLEYAVGVVLTLPVGLLFWSARSAGELIDIKTGANNNAIFANVAGGPEGPAQILMSQLAMLTFLASNGMQVLIQSLWHSYTWIPIGSYGQLTTAALPELATQFANQLAGLTLHLFGPFFVVFLLVEFGIGLMGKFATQLQVNTIAAPAKSLLFPLVLLLLLQAPAFLGTPVATALNALEATLKPLLAR